jgi:RNA-binding protein
MKLKQVGEVLHLAKSGKLIVRLNPSYDLSIIGQSVVDMKGTRIGKIIELLGPVKSPLASALPIVDATKMMNGMAVFQTEIFSRHRDESMKQMRRSSKNLFKAKRK